MQEEQAKPDAPRKFWDGFQWVEPQAPVVGQPDMSMQTVSQQTRHERRLYVGNLQPGVTGDQISDFLNNLMDTCLQGAGVRLPDGYTKSVISVWIGPSANYAFVEFVTKECATIAIGLR